MSPRTGPAICFGMLHDSRPNRITFDISDRGPQVTFAGAAACSGNDRPHLETHSPDGFRVASHGARNPAQRDSQIGRRLYRIFIEAGLSHVELSVQPEVHWHGSEGFGAWTQNLIGNIESARRGLLDSRLCTDFQLDTAVAELARLLQDRTASAIFVWNRAKGVNKT
jgi:hypothetical protein